MGIGSREPEERGRQGLGIRSSRSRTTKIRTVATVPFDIQADTEVHVSVLEFEITGTLNELTFTGTTSFKDGARDRSLPVNGGLLEPGVGHSGRRYRKDAIRIGWAVQGRWFWALCRRRGRDGRWCDGPGHGTGNASRLTEPMRGLESTSR